MSTRVQLEAVRVPVSSRHRKLWRSFSSRARNHSTVTLTLVSREAMRTIDPLLPEGDSGQKHRLQNTGGVRYFYKTVGTDELLKLEKNAGVYMEMLFRKGIRDEYRREALVGLAKFDKKPELKVLIDSLKMQDESSSAG